MANIEYSSLVNRIRGRVSHGVLSHNKGKGVLRRHNSTIHLPRTELQQNARGHFSDLKGLWYSLSDAQKELWNSLAAASPGAGSGLNAFVQHNLRIRMADHADLSQINSPPPTPSTPGHIQGHELLRVAATTMRYQWTGPDDTATWVELYWAKAAGFDIRSKDKFRHVATTRSDDTYIEWTNDYPLETPILVKARTIDLYGRISPWTNILKWEHGLPAPMGEGCVLYLPMDEGAGTTAYDQSSHQNNGVIHGATWVAGKYKYALYFDGLDDYANCGSGITITDDITVQAFITPFRFYTTPQGWRPLVCNDGGYPDNGLSIEQSPAGGYWRAQFRFASGPSWLPGPTIAINQTSHLLITRRKSNGCAQLYLDGLLYGQSYSKAGEDLLSGTYRIAGSFGFFQGSVEEVRIYNRVLSANEAYDHYSRLQ